MNIEVIINIIITISYFSLNIRFRIFIKYLFIISIIPAIFKLTKSKLNIIKFPIIYFFSYYIILDNNPLIHTITLYLPWKKIIRCLLYYSIISYLIYNDNNSNHYFPKLIIYFKNHGYQFIFLNIILFCLKLFLLYYENILFIYFFPKNHFIDLTEKYYICANIFNNEEILPNWINEMKKLITYLGIKNVYISIFENGDSIDNSGEILNNFSIYLSNLSIPNKIVTQHIVNKKGRERINFLSEIRNKALEYLYEIPNINYNKTRILFLNDIIYKYQDVIKLISTNNRNYDVACPLDFYLGFYDTWVSVDLNGMHFRRHFPFVNDKISSDLILNQENMRVFSCWNGMISMKALPWKNQLISFRDSSRNISSECTLMNADLYLNGYRKVIINPKIEVAYEDYWYYVNRFVYHRNWFLKEYFKFYFFGRWKNNNLYLSEDLESESYELSEGLKKDFENYYLK